MSEKLSEENRALIERLESHLGISPQTADYLIEHWGQANILLNAARAEARPIDMVLHCPACGLQHIDEATPEWDNPPHRSHLCFRCGHIWRPSDVATNGVVALQTRGKSDSPLAEGRPAPVVDREAVARVLSPEAFYGVSQWMDRLNLNQIDALYEVQRWAKARFDAKKKADAILALLSPATSPGEGSSGGRVQAAPDGATEAQRYAGEVRVRIGSAGWHDDSDGDTPSDVYFRFVCALDQEEPPNWPLTMIWGSQFRLIPVECDASSPAEGRAGTPATDEPQPPSRDNAGGGG